MPGSSEIVDDEVDACANLSDILTDLGYRVDVAYDGQSALELVQEQDYDLKIAELERLVLDLKSRYETQSQIDANKTATQIAIADINNASKERCSINSFMFDCSKA